MYKHHDNINIYLYCYEQLIISIKIGNEYVGTYFANGMDILRTGFPRLLSCNIHIHGTHGSVYGMGSHRSESTPDGGVGHETLIQ